MLRYRVLYYSSHRYEHGNFWPNLRQSDVDYVGVHKGQGYNINVPLNEVSGSCVACDMTRQYRIDMNV